MAGGRDRAWQRGRKSSQSLGFVCCVRDALTVLSGATRYFRILAFRQDTHGENDSPKLPVCKHNQHSKKSKNVVTRQIAITLLVSIQKFWYAPASQAIAAARDRRHAG